MDSHGSIKRLYGSVFRDSLYRGSILIMASSILNSAIGFLFWILAAGRYQKDDVGIAIGLISLASLPIILSRFGLEQSLVRYFPEGDRSRVFGTSAVITTFSAVLIAIVFVLLASAAIPGMEVIRSDYMFYLLFVAAMSLVSITGTSLIALRETGLYLLQNLLANLKVVFVVLLISLGALGIFTSVGLAFLISLLFTSVVLFRLGIRLGRIDLDFLRESFHFSMGNYVSGILSTAPALVIPIMVLGVLGAAQTANFYIAYAVYSMLLVIPFGFSTALFVEGSYGGSLKQATSRVNRGVFILLLPAVTALYFLGGPILGIVGSSYVEGLDLLRIFVLSSFFASFTSIYASVMRVQRRMMELVILNGVTSILSMVGSFVLIAQIGIVGVGYAWVLSYGVGCLVIWSFLRSGRLPMESLAETASR